MHYPERDNEQDFTQVLVRVTSTLAAIQTKAAPEAATRKKTPGFEKSDLIRSLGAGIKPTTSKRTGKAWAKVKQSPPKNLIDRLRGTNGTCWHQFLIKLL